MNFFDSKIDNKAYWETLKELKSVDKQDNNLSNPISLSNWQSYFTDLHKAPSEDNDFDKEMIEMLRELEKQPFFNELNYIISENEIRKAIKILKSMKAPGPDNITGEMIKCAELIILPILKHLFNYILSNGKYPKMWSEGHIVPIFKKGCAFFEINYRGITLNCALSKLFGIVLNNRLKEFCKSNRIIDDRQASHKAGSRTVDNALIMNTIFEKHCKKGDSKLYVAFIDFKKAFDLVPHNALFYKLLNLGIAGNFYEVIKSLYKNASARVKIENKLSESIKISRGLKQGDMLSPLLFNIFINDIIKEFEKPECDAPTLINDLIIGCLLYADDLVIFSKSAEGLQNSLNNLFNYCKKWKIEEKV